VLMLVYIILGLPRVNISNFEPFAPQGVAAIFFTTGFVFVSYAGILKIASVAEEIKNPARNIPMGMILSLLVVSIFYSLMVLVTAGVLDGAKLSRSLTPISDGAEVFMGLPGKLALAVAAILAFLSTANAGIMTAARSLVPLSHDGLLPQFIGRINLKFRTPHNSLILTGCFIVAALFLSLKILVEAASVVLILTNLLSCVSVIILRESRLQNYQPEFRAPLYPWLQIIGIIGFTLLILEMGKEAHLASLILVLGGLFVYCTTYSLEAELKEIIRERDQIVKDRFDHVIENCPVLDIEHAIKVEDFFKLVADAMAPRLYTEPRSLLQSLLDREKQSSTVLTPSLAIPHVVIEGRHTFGILLARCKDGVFFGASEPLEGRFDPVQGSALVQAVFVIVGTKDERNFHLFCLSAIAQIVQDPNFEKKWMAAKRVEGLRDIVLLGKRRRQKENRE